MQNIKGAQPERRRTPLPPFARRLIDLRSRGCVPEDGDIGVSVGSWDYFGRPRHGAGHRRQGVIVLPPGEIPSAFAWWFVAGLPALLIVDEADLGTADELARLLIEAGSTGCAALIRSGSSKRCGWKLYQSHFEEIRCAA